jgi:hypothetical protein
MPAAQGEGEEMEQSYYEAPHYTGCRDSSVGTATSYWLEDGVVGVPVPVESRIFTSPCRPDRLWSPSNLLYDG